MPASCNWCGGKFSSAKSQHYCDKCAQYCFRECVRCHRPFPLAKYFRLSELRCNSCERKYRKEKERRNNSKKIGCDRSLSGLVTKETMPKFNESKSSAQNRFATVSEEEEEEIEEGPDTGGGSENEEEKGDNEFGQNYDVKGKVKKMNAAKSVGSHRYNPVIKKGAERKKKTKSEIVINSDSNCKELKYLLLQQLVQLTDPVSNSKKAIDSFSIVL